MTPNVQNTPFSSALPRRPGLPWEFDASLGSEEAGFVVIKKFVRSRHYYKNARFIIRPFEQQGLLLVTGL